MIVLNNQLQSHLQDSNDEYNEEIEHREESSYPYQELNGNDNSTNGHPHSNQEIPCSNGVTGGQSIRLDIAGSISPSLSVHVSCSTIVHLILAGTIGYYIGCMNMHMGNTHKVIASSWRSSFPFTAATILIFLAIFLHDSFQYYQKYHRNDNDHEHNDDDHDHDHDHISNCRHRVQKALGSIHAPSISMIQTQSFQCTTTSHEQHQQLNNEMLLRFTLLAEHYAELSNKMNHAMEIIRMVSSIRLGLGPVSPAVERVEDSIHGREREKGSIFAGGGSSSLSAKKMRLILFQALKEQNASLCSIMKNAMRSHSNDDNDDDDDMNIFNTMDETQVCTLSLLKSCKRYNDELLSKLLSTAFDTFAFLPTNEKMSKELKERIESSITMAKEQYTYLESCFAFDLDERTGILNSIGGKHIAELQKHIHASHVMLWAFMQSLDEKDDASCAVVGLETKSLWNDLTYSLQNVAHVHQSLGQSLFPDDEMSSCEGNSDDGVDADIATPNTEPMQYDHEGKAIIVVRTDTEDPRLKNKTLVFTGKGSKMPHPKRTSSSSAPKRGLDMMPASFHESAGRLILLKELQARLNTIEFPEELETSTLTDDVQDDPIINGGTRNHAKSDRSTNFFMGVSGNLLLELKDAMAERSDDHVIGCSDAEVDDDCVDDSS